jgi:hypothetical protein
MTAIAELHWIRWGEEVSVKKEKGQQTQDQGQLSREVQPLSRKYCSPKADLNREEEGAVKLEPPSNLV